MNDDLLRKSADLRGIADIRLLSLEDGPGRGQRLLVARNGRGIGFEVAADRGFDISALSLAGINLGWHSPTQLPFPPVDADSEQGWGFLRNFDGFMVTCGLDHLSRPREVDVGHYNHPHLKAIRMPLHGRIAVARAKLEGYGVDQRTGEVFCEGTVRQASVFGEVLELRRRIAMPIDGEAISITDRVTNRGFRPSGHAILYHLNFGYPFLEEDLRIAGVPPELAAALRADPPRPDDDYGEKVDSIDSSRLADPDGVTLSNPTLGVSVGLQFGRERLDRFAIWRAYQSGVFALGLEPKTQAADAQPLLQPGESRDYWLTLRMRRM